MSHTSSKSFGPLIFLNKKKAINLDLGELIARFLIVEIKQTNQLSNLKLWNS